jgi:hypothetical protein
MTYRDAMGGKTLCASLYGIRAAWMGQLPKGFADGYFSDRAKILLGQPGKCKNLYKNLLDNMHLRTYL